jgi:hypothetical protein
VQRLVVESLAHDAIVAEEDARVHAADAEAWRIVAHEAAAMLHAAHRREQILRRRIARLVADVQRLRAAEGQAP